MLHVQIPRELDRGQALGGVHEQADRPEKIDEGQLARGEDGAGGDAELPVTGRALEPASSAQIVDVEATAERANRSAIRLGPSQPAEPPIRGALPFLVDRPERQGPGGSGKQEMLGHGRLATRNMFPSCSRSASKARAWCICYLRPEQLNETMFRNLAHARVAIAARAAGYNTERPPSALDHQTPAVYARTLTTAIARPAARDESSARRAIAQPAPTGVNTNWAPIATG